MRFVAYAVAAFIGAATFGLGTASASDARVDALMRNFDRPNAPGASVAVIKDGALIHAKGYGLADVEARVAASSTTNFRLASLTKQFTAMAVMILKDRGALSYDQALPDVIPDFPTYGRSIKIRHLLGHTSGLRDYEGLIPPGTPGQVSDRDVVDILKNQRSTYFTPGSAYQYSNSGYATLAVIVENVSGQTFAEFLAENVFAPLGMDGTVAFVDGVNTVPNRAFGYTARGGGFDRTDQSQTSAVLGDGGVYTSATDWLQWDQALYGEQLVSASTLAEAFRPGRLNDGRATSYGYGWVVDTYRSIPRVSHTGSTIGFRTAVQRFPSKRLTVLVLINRANTVPWDLAEQIADLYL